MNELETNEQAYERIVSGLCRYREQTKEAMQLVTEAHERKIWEQRGLKSFREFCEQECNFSKQWGYELLRTNRIILSLTEGSDDLELNEAAMTLTPNAARLLEPYDSEKRTRIIREAKLTGEVTTKSIGEVIRNWKESLEQHEAKITEHLCRIHKIILDLFEIGFSFEEVLVHVQEQALAEGLERWKTLEPILDEFLPAFDEPVTGSLSEKVLLYFKVLAYLAFGECEKENFDENE